MHSRQHSKVLPLLPPSRPPALPSRGKEREWASFQGGKEGEKRRRGGGRIIEGEEEGEVVPSMAATELLGMHQRVRRKKRRRKKRVRRAGRERCKGVREEGMDEGTENSRFEAHVV